MPASLFGTSIRRLADGRVLVRNTYAYAPGYGVTESLRQRAKQRQLLSLRRRFPHIETLDIDYSWGGVISFFRGANGFFGEVAPAIYAATISGMPVCLLYGQQLAELALGGGSDTLDFVCQRSQPGGLPPAASPHPRPNRPHRRRPATAACVEGTIAESARNRAGYQASVSASCTYCGST